MKRLRCAGDSRDFAHGSGAGKEHGRDRRRAISGCMAAVVSWLRRCEAEAGLSRMEDVNSKAAGFWVVLADTNDTISSCPFDNVAAQFNSLRGRLGRCERHKANYILECLHKALEF
jgi:hypothetical protein